MFLSTSTKVYILCLYFSVDLTDSAIRHENGKQVARWNVDPSKFASPSMAASAISAAANNADHRPSSSSGGSLPPLTYISHPQTPLNGVHPAANRNQGYTTSTPGQPHPSSRHQPNGNNVYKTTHLSLVVERSAIKR